jgi:hypothetical protein
MPPGTSCREIGGGREEARVAGDPTEPPGARVVHVPLDPLPVAELGRSRPVAERPFGTKGRLGHFERREDVRLGEGVELLAGHAAHHLLEDEEPHVAVDEPLARPKLGNDVVDVPHGFRPTVVERREERLDRKTRRVREELPEGDPPFAVAAELGHVGCRRRVEGDLPSFGEDQDARRRRDRLRQGGEVEDGVPLHRRPLGEERAGPVGLLEEDAVVAADGDHAPWDLPLRDRIADRLGDRREADVPVDSGRRYLRRRLGRGLRGRDERDLWRNAERNPRGARQHERGDSGDNEMADRGRGDGRVMRKRHAAAGRGGAQRASTNL